MHGLEAYCGSVLGLAMIPRTVCEVIRANMNQSRARRRGRQVFTPRELYARRRIRPVVTGCFLVGP